MEFIEYYDVYDGMPDNEFKKARKTAKDKLLLSLNSWKGKGKYKIINIESTYFNSQNSDHSPFWEKLVVYYENV